MGSPVSPLLASLFMEWLEKQAIATAPVECIPNLSKRYVDDVLELIKKGQVRNLTDHINTIDPTGNIKFTSLTSVLSKIMERIIVNKIYKFLTAHSVLHRAQHGFVRGSSVCSNLLESLNDWTVYVQSRNQTTIIYVDFSKAFDVVSHEKLFIRLQSYKIGGTVLLWLQHFFCGRTHQTKIGDSSDLLFLLSVRVIQGSAIIMVNDTHTRRRRLKMATFDRPYTAFY